MHLADMAVTREDGNALRNAIKGSYFHELTPTVAAGVQMASDVAILTTLSFLSLASVIYFMQHEGITYYLYLLPTSGAVVVLVLGFARAGAYDVFLTNDRTSVLSSTVTQLVRVMLL